MKTFFYKLRRRTGRKFLLVSQFLNNPKKFVQDKKLAGDGIDIELLQKLTQPWLQELGIRTILDIGANKGAFAKTASIAFPDADIFCFEPQKELSQRIRHFVQAERLHVFDIALGSQNKTLRFNQLRHKASSSILKPLYLDNKKHGIVPIQNVIEVQQRRLDDVLKDLHLKTPLFVKIDVQGYEREVIAGGVNLIRCANVICIETSFEPIYEGQPLFEEIYDLLRSLSFCYYGSWGELFLSRDGRYLQQDSLFISN